MITRLVKKLEKMKRGLITTHNHSEALVIESRGRSKTNNFHKRDKSESPNKSRIKIEIICYNCGKARHIKMNCRFLKREYSRKEIKVMRIKMIKTRQQLHVTMMSILIMMIIL